MIDFCDKTSYDIQDLLTIMKLLRSPEGCPWDKEQNHHSIRNNFIEETYEVVEAIDNNDSELLKEELGDVLLQVVFHSQMESEKNAFSFDDVTTGICKKLIERHPHIFGNVKVNSTDDVLANWDNIKKKQKHQETVTESLDAVPKVYPSLMRAQKVQSRAAKAGFDFPTVGDALVKLNEEMDELCLAVCEGDTGNIFEEMGDLFFSAVNISRFLKVESEEALQKATEKFINRFRIVEELAKQNGINMKEAPIEELDKLWNIAKRK